MGGASPRQKVLCCIRKHSEAALRDRAVSSTPRLELQFLPPYPFPEFLSWPPSMVHCDLQGKRDIILSKMCLVMVFTTAIESKLNPGNL